MRLPRVRFTVDRLMVAVALGGLALGVSEWLARPLRHEAWCRANLRAIGLALQAYHAAHGSYPPAFVADAAGKPIHSWRALLLPYLDEPELAGAYRLDEPWDGPHNAELASRVPAAYRCPAHDREGCSSYGVVVGPETAWPGPVGISMAQVVDGWAYLTIELEGGVPWPEPRDLTIGPIFVSPRCDHDENRRRADLVLADLRRQGLATTRRHPHGMNLLVSPLLVRSRPFDADEGEDFQEGLTIAAHPCCQQL